LKFGICFSNPVTLIRVHKLEYFELEYRIQFAFLGGVATRFQNPVCILKR